MATHQFTTTPEQEQVLDYVLELRNAERAARNPPLAPLTMQAVVDSLVVKMLDEHTGPAEQRRRDRLIDAYEGASPAARAAARAALGI